MKKTKTSLHDVVHCDYHGFGHPPLCNICCGSYTCDTYPSMKVISKHVVDEN